MAKERLQLIIAHERNGLSGKKGLSARNAEGTDCGYLEIRGDQTRTTSRAPLEKQGNYEVPVNIVLPEPGGER